jgi:hypothetical protein
VIEQVNLHNAYLGFYNVGVYQGVSFFSIMSFEF